MSSLTRRFLSLAVLLILGGILTYAEDDNSPVEKIQRIESSDGYRELSYSDDRLSSERSFDRQGALQSERFYDENRLLSEIRRYYREKGRLKQVKAFDPLGKEIGAIDYRYDAEGRLLGVDLSGVLGSGTAGMLSSDQGPEASWTQDNQTTVYAYNDQGQIEGRYTMKDSATLSAEKREYSEKGRLESTSLEGSKGSLTQKTIYDKDGRVQETIEGEGENTVHTKYRYDEKGRISESSKSQGTHRISSKFSYDSDGKLIKTEISLDGVLQSVRQNLKDSTIEEFYDEGQLFVRASYKDGRKIKDEFFADGKILRTREYE